MSQPSPARRGTRPRNRRELILTAAAGLFVEQGFSKVPWPISPTRWASHLRRCIGTSRQATDPRHGPGGRAGAGPGPDAHAGPGRRGRHDQPGVLRPRQPPPEPDVAARSTQPRPRGLPAAQRRHPWHRSATDWLRPCSQAGPGRSRRDLLAWSIIAVLTSPSFHHLDLPRPAYEVLLAELADAVLRPTCPRRRPPHLPRQAPRV